MHGLPKVAPLDAHFVQLCEHFTGRHAATCLQQSDGQPAVRFRTGELWLHGQRQAFQVFAVACKDGPLLLHAQRQHLHLPAPNARADVAHAVVVADFLVLIPRRVLARLRGELQCVLRLILRPAQQHPAARGGDDLIAIEGKSAEVTKGAALLPIVCRTQRLCCVLDQGNIMLAANSGNFVQLRGVAVQVNDDHRLGRAVQRKGAAQSGGVHIPRLPLRVDKHRLRAAVGHGIGGGRKGQALAKDRVACLHAREDHRKVQRRRTGREGDRISLAHKFAHGLFKFVDVLAQRCDPVLLKRIVDVLQFIALVRHMRAGQQKPFIHVCLLCFSSTGCQNLLRSGVFAAFKSATNLRHFFLPLRHTEMRKFIDPCILPSPTRKTLGLHHFYFLIVLHVEKKRNA